MASNGGRKPCRRAPSPILAFNGKMKPAHSRFLETGCKDAVKSTRLRRGHDLSPAGTPRPASWYRAWAGLLARGSNAFAAFPDKASGMGAKRSPLTVARAATVLAPDG